jgi:hypothetical protein
MPAPELTLTMTPRRVAEGHGQPPSEALLEPIGERALQHELVVQTIKAERAMRREDGHERARHIRKLNLL